MRVLSTIFFFTWLTSEAFCQGNPELNTTATSFIHIKDANWFAAGPPGELIGFVVENKDTSGVSNWKSPLITTFDKDESGYLIKLNVPVTVLKNTIGGWCIAYYNDQTTNGKDTIPIRYGGVTLSNIKLHLKSTPEGAETFLIPNRIWMQKVKNTKWQKDNSIIENYRVNTSSTNTFAFIDETVFVVLFKLNNKYKKIIHKTQPMSIQAEQTAWIEF